MIELSPVWQEQGGGTWGWRNDAGQHGGDDVETEVVLVAPWPRPPESEVEHAALAATHGGQGPGAVAIPTPIIQARGMAYLCIRVRLERKIRFFNERKSFYFSVIFCQAQVQSITVHSNSIFSFLHYRVSQKKGQQRFRKFPFQRA